MSKLLRAMVSLALLGWVGWNTDWHHVGQAFAHLRVGYWFSAVAILVGCQVISAKRWQLLARPLGVEGTFAQFTGYYLIGMFFNLVLPTSVGGDVVRACYLTTQSGKRLPTFVSVLVDRINGLMVLLAMACLAVTWMWRDLPGWIVGSVWTASVCVWLGMLALPWLARFGKDGQARVQQVRTMLQLLHHPRLLVQTSLLSLIIQAANVLLVWQVGLALRADIPGSYYWVLVPMVSVLTLLPVSVNGMGVREGGTALLLAPLGVSQATAVTLAFLWFAVYAAVSLLSGLVYLFGRFPQPRTEEKSDHGPVDRDSDQGRTRQLGQAA